ncbi:MAG: YiiX/YebB-like N1pC/P60 family cysteine hydrolase [Planctomycetaceae bacterium]
MPSFMLTLVLIAGSPSLDTEAGFDSLPTAAAAIGPTLQNGSLIFSAGDCLAVRIFTASPYTHVATVVVDGQGERFVYDSTGGVGVRKLPLATYLATQAPVRIEVHHPVQPLSDKQSRQLERYLESQLGRPYAIQHHLTGERCAGLHCAEYVTDALMSIDVVRAKQPARVSPVSLRTGIVRHHVYTAGTSIRLQRPAPTVRGGSACEQMWLDTKACCRNCCRKLSGWFLCQ